MNEQIKKVIDLAKEQIGYRETKSNITKYASDFDTKYPDFYNYKKQGAAWCDIFVDWLFVTAFGEDEALKMLCQPKKSAGAGCKFSAEYYAKKGRFMSEPQAGDQIFFVSNGEINHTGIVTDVDTKKVYTIEGNSSNTVKAHSYALSNNKIAGYGRPIWSAAEVAEQSPQNPQNSLKLSDEEIALQVINGMWGNGKERRQRLTEAGYNYDAIQKIVNRKLGVSTKPSASESLNKKIFIGIVATKKDPLNIRSGAGIQYPVIGQLPKGSSIRVCADRSGGWYKLADREGYVAGNLIQVNQ